MEIMSQKRTIKRSIVDGNTGFKPVPVEMADEFTLQNAKPDAALEHVFVYTLCVSPLSFL